MAAETAIAAGHGWAAKSGVPPKTGVASGGPEDAVLLGIVLAFAVLMLAVAALILPDGRGKPTTRTRRLDEPDPEADEPRVAALHRPSRPTVTAGEVR